MRHRFTEIRLGFRLALLAAVLVAAGFGVGSLTNARSNSERQQHDVQLLIRYERANRALAARSLPSGIKRVGPSCGGSLCGQSELNPPQLAARLRGFAGPGRTPVTNAATRLLNGVCPANACPTVVFGRFDGFTVDAIAFWHLLEHVHGSPPVGTITRRAAGRKVFFRGSDVTVSLVAPSAISQG